MTDLIKEELTSRGCMSVEALLTVITVLLAVVAVIPQERGQDLRIRLGTSATLVGAVAGIVVVYLCLLEQIHSMPGVRSLSRPIPWVGRWDAPSTSLLALLLAIAFAVGSYRRRLPVQRVSRLARVIANGMTRRRFGECLHLLEAHIGVIQDALQGEYWQERLRRCFFPTTAELFIRARERNAAVKVDAQKAVDLLVDEAVTQPVEQALPNINPAMLTPSKRGPFVHWLIASAASPQRAAEDLVRLMSLSPAFIEEIASANPYLGLRILQLRSSWLASEFADTYARALLNDPKSVLYRELKRAENFDSNNMLGVDPHEQPLLSALCADAIRPEGPALLYTFLDLGIDPMRSGKSAELTRILNGPMLDYRERGRWTSPPFVTLFLLEIVCPRIIADPKAQMPNLYVIRTHVDAILAQLDPDENVDLLREWPTPSHYLLYEAVSSLTGLVRRLEPGIVMPIDAVDPADARMQLPRHAIGVLGAVMYACLRSDRIDAPFKGYLLGVWWRAYRDRYRGDWPHSADVLEALAAGGSLGAGDMRHRQGIADALKFIDVIDRVGAGGDALRSRFEIPGA